MKQKVKLMDEGAMSGAFEIFEVSFVSCSEGACKGYDGYITIVKLQDKAIPYC